MLVHEHLFNIFEVQDSFIIPWYQPLNLVDKFSVLFSEDSLLDLELFQRLLRVSCQFVELLVPVGKVLLELLDQSILQFAPVVFMHLGYHRPRLSPENVFEFLYFDLEFVDIVNRV